MQSARVKEAITRPVVLFCTSERGSAGALSALEKAGEADVHDIDGGFRALEATGIRTDPVTTSTR
jgi:rhodanese-related sulfurtransferase